MGSLFAKDAVVRKVDAEGALLLGGGRALLMQLAHPSVAAGVAEHSGFERDPFQRLRATLDATYTIVFGSEAEARTVAAQVRAVHDRVQGEGYSANDPALLLWVHATLVDTALRVYTRLLGRLTPAEEAEYYEQSTLIAELLGCPRSAQPDDLVAFRDYVRTMVATLEVSDDARRLAASVLHPRLPRVAEPPLALVRFVTVGMLPPPIRDQYGFTWDRRRGAALGYATAAAGRVLPLVPRFVRHAPLAVLT